LPPQTQRFTSTTAKQSFSNQQRSQQLLEAENKTSAADAHKAYINNAEDYNKSKLKKEHIISQVLKNHMRSAHLLQPENLDEEDNEGQTLLGLSKIEPIKQYTAADFQSARTLSFNLN